MLLMVLLSTSVYGSQLGDYFLEHLNRGETITLEKVKAIYAREHSLNDKKDVFGSPLHQAVKFSNLEVVKFLISKGARVNGFSSFIGTPLHVAVAYAKADIVKFLIQKGAKTKVKNGMGLTPFAMAKIHHYKYISHYLNSKLISKKHKSVDRIEKKVKYKKVVLVKKIVKVESVQTDLTKEASSTFEDLPFVQTLGVVNVSEPYLLSSLETF